MSVELIAILAAGVALAGMIPTANRGLWGCETVLQFGFDWR